MTGRRPLVALVPWHDRFEDFHDSIGVTVETFRTEHVGSWMFNYIEALRHAGVDTVLVYGSARIADTVRFHHEPSGADVVLLPVPWAHRKAQGVRDRYLPSSVGMRSLESYLSVPVVRLRRELRRAGCDIVLCQEYESGRFDVCVALARAMRIPVFATYQGGVRRTRVESAPRRAALAAVSGLVVGASRERERLTGLGVPPGKLADIPNPVDVSAWSPLDRDSARRALDVPPGAFVVAWHGRVEVDVKGLDVLVHAWRRFAEKHARDDVLLTLTGTGTDADRLARELRDVPNVRWHDGFVRERDTLRAHLSAADVYVLPSRNEGFPIAPIEAMAIGLPVVAADAPGVRDVLGPDDAAGFVVPVGDAPALATAIGRLVDEPARRVAMAQAARARAVECFSLDAVGERLADFLTTGGR